MDGVLIRLATVGSYLCFLINNQLSEWICRCYKACWLLSGDTAFVPSVRLLLHAFVCLSFARAYLYPVHVLWRQYRLWCTSVILCPAVWSVCWAYFGSLDEPCLSDFSVVCLFLPDSLHFLFVRGHLWSSSFACPWSTSFSQVLLFVFYLVVTFHFLEQPIYFVAIFHFFLFIKFVTVYIMFKLFASLSVEPPISILSSWSRRWWMTWMWCMLCWSAWGFRWFFQFFINFRNFRHAVHVPVFLHSTTIFGTLLVPLFSGGGDDAGDFDERHAQCWRCWTAVRAVSSGCLCVSFFAVFHSLPNSFDLHCLNSYVLHEDPCMLM